MKLICDKEEFGTLVASCVNITDGYSTGGPNCARCSLVSFCSHLRPQSGDCIAPASLVLLCEIKEG